MGKIRSEYYQPFVSAPSDDPELEAAKENLVRILRELTELYNRTHSSDPIKEVKVGTATVNPRGYARPAELEWSNTVVVTMEKSPNMESRHHVER
ncbi:MAG: hypothetical protein JJU11_11415 [Candidatus Sumerlaeia bacterium]|nr:hypothetical protein [Candidatus Sumerlaeia bacterium]